MRIYYYNRSTEIGYILRAYIYVLYDIILLLLSSRLDHNYPHVTDLTRMPRDWTPANVGKTGSGPLD